MRPLPGFVSDAALLARRLMIAVVFGVSGWKGDGWHDDLMLLVMNIVVAIGGGRWQIGRLLNSSGS